MLEFPIRITFIDQVITCCPTQIIELQLNSTFLTASECLVLAANPKLESLRVLDLSCNPITALGLINLVHPRRSSFQALQTLTLFNCEIDFTQSYLISNDNLDDSKVNFSLRTLNLSYNNLSFLLNYVIELNLVNDELQKLWLVSCAVDDEQILKLVDSKKTDSLQTLDLSENLLDANFPVISKVIRDQCPQLSDLILGGNKNLKNSPNMQVAKPKK